MSVQSSTFPNSRASVSWAWALGLLAALLAAVAFRGSLVELAGRWTSREEYSHCFLVPLVSAWLLWMRRDALLTTVGRPAWAGPILVLIAVLMNVMSQLSAMFIFSQLAFVIALLGIVLATGGMPSFMVAFVPIGFLAFAIPLPSFVDASLSLHLQLLSSQLGVAFIDLFGIPVYLEGNVIDLGVYKLQVVDACSGLRYLFPLFSLSFLAAYLFRGPLWQRALVLISSVPITIALNGFRIGIVGVTVERWGPKMADGVLHFFEGWVIFVAAALLLLLEIYLLSRVSGKRLFESYGVPIRASNCNAVAATDQRPLYACLGLILAMLFTSPLISGRVENAPERSHFVTFPAKIGDWQGRTSLLEPQVEQRLALDDYILSDYVDSEERVVSLYVAYYQSQRTGESPHSPLVCIPGDGWSISTFERTSYGPDRPLNRAVIERNGSRQLVYYWYEERGRKIASEYWSKWYLLYDVLTKNRSDGALVRVITPILPDELERDADARLQLFIRNLGSTLNAFLASGDALKKG